MSNSSKDGKGKKYRAKRSELLATITELDKLNTDLRVWGSRGWDFAQKECDRLKTVHAASNAAIAQAEQRAQEAENYAATAARTISTLEKQTESLRAQLTTAEDKLRLLRGGKIPFSYDPQRPGRGSTYYNPAPIPGVTTTNGPQWYQPSLFENTDDGTNRKTVSDVAGMFCRPCNRTFQPGVTVCGRCSGPLSKIDPGRPL